MVDQAKRKTLKAVMYSGVGAAAISTSGAIAAPAKALLAEKPSTTTTNAGLSITHYDNFNGHTVLIRNTSDRRLSLQNIYPSKVSTPTGKLDLQKIVAQGDLSIPANTTQAVSVSDQGVVHQYARWTHIDGEISAFAPHTGSQFVSVNGRYGAGLPTITPRTHIASIA